MAMDYDGDVRQVWNDGFEVNDKKFILVKKSNDVQMRDEIHQLISKIGISKVEVGNDVFYSMDFDDSYLNFNTVELEALYLMIGKVLRHT